MERATKVLLISSLVMVALASATEGSRRLKETVAEPQNFLGGGAITGGLVPSPGGGVGFRLGPSVFCSFPGTGCVPIQPTIPGVPTVPSTGTGTATKSPPLP